MGKLRDRWNKNKFSVYDSEEKTVLRMLQNMYNWLSNFADEVDNKSDLYGDHKGSWQGIPYPTISEEGMRGTVEKLDSQYNSLVEKMQDIYKITNTILPSSLKGVISLVSGQTYTFTDLLNIEDGSIILMNGATIQGNGKIVLNNNVIIENGTIVCNDIITRDSDGIVTNSNALVIEIKSEGVVVKNTYLKGCVFNIDGAKNFLIEGNVIESGYTVGGAISLWNKTSYGIIKNNDIMGSNTNGIGVHTSNNITILRNKLHNNRHSGVWTPYSTHLNISFNECYLNSEDGLDLNFGADNEYMNFKSFSTIYGNVCHDNKKTGIYLVGGDVIIEKNHCYENYTNGIRTGIWRSGDTTFAENVQVLNNRVLNNNKGGNAIGSTYTHQMLLQRLNGALIKGNRITNPNNYANAEYNLYCVVAKSIIAENFSRSAKGELSFYIHDDTSNPLGNVLKDNITL